MPGHVRSLNSALCLWSRLRRHVVDVRDRPVVEEVAASGGHRVGGWQGTHQVGYIRAVK